MMGDHTVLAGSGKSIRNKQVLERLGGMEPKGRKCRTCGTPLSRYNTGTNCHLHKLGSRPANGV